MTSVHLWSQDVNPTANALDTIDAHIVKLTNPLVSYASMSIDEAQENAAACQREAMDAYEALVESPVDKSAAIAYIGKMATASILRAYAETKRVRR